MARLPDPEPQPDPEPESQPAPAPEPPEDPPPHVVLEIEAAWDAKPGDDRIALYSDGRLVAGDEEGRAEMPVSDGYFFDKQAALSVVRFDKKAAVNAIVVALPTPDDEDPPQVYQVFVSEAGKLRRIFHKTIGSYNVTPLKFRGNGTARYLEDGWTACGREDFPKVAQRQFVTLRRDAKGMLAKESRKKSGKTMVCDQLAACPFVYVVDGDQAQRIGEILRNIRGLAAATEQGLELPAGARRVEIREEKPEVTHLDAVALEVDGPPLRPRRLRRSRSSGLLRRRRRRSHPARRRRPAPRVSGRAGRRPGATPRHRLLRGGAFGRVILRRRRDGAVRPNRPRLAAGARADETGRTGLGGVTVALEEDRFQVGERGDRLMTSHVGPPLLRLWGPPRGPRDLGGLRERPPG